MVFATIAKVLLSLIVLLLSVLLAAIITIMLERESLVAISIFASLVIIAIAGLCVYAIIAIGRKQKKAAEEKPKKAKKAKPLAKGKFDIVSGLPVPAGAKCKIELYPDLMKIESVGQLFTLDQRRIFNVSIIKKSQIQKQCVSSAGGAVAGALLFGAIGAVVGGGTKVVNLKNVDRFLAFSYWAKDGKEAKQIIFAIKNGFGDRSGDFIYLFKDRSKKIYAENSL